jgi:hypothetical protein
MPFTELDKEEQIDAKNAARVLAATFALCGYPPEVTRGLKLTFQKFANEGEAYRMELSAPGRTMDDFESGDVVAHTLYYIGMLTPNRHLNMDGQPLVLSEDFRAPIRFKAWELFDVVMKIAPNIVERFGDRPAGPPQP